MSPVGDFAGHALVVVEIAGLIQRFHAQDALSVALAHLIDAQIAGDLIQPRKTLSSRPESGRSACTR